MDISRVRRLVGVGFFFVGAVLLAVAPFLSFVAAGVPSKENEEPVRVRITGWGVDSGFGDPSTNVPGNGNPLVFAAILLAAAGITTAWNSSRAASPRKRQVVVVSSAIAAAFAAGAAWTVVEQVISWNRMFDGFGDIGAGFWLVLVGAALALCAAVLTMRGETQDP